MNRTATKILLLFILPICLNSCAWQTRQLTNEEFYTRLTDEYQKITFENGIDAQEAETIVFKYVIENEKSVSMGGLKNPIDEGNNWRFKQSNCFGHVIEEYSQMLVNKKTGEVTWIDAVY